MRRTRRARAPAVPLVASATTWVCGDSRRAEQSSCASTVGGGADGRCAAGGRVAGTWTTTRGAVARWTTLAARRYPRPTVFACRPCARHDPAAKRRAASAPAMRRADITRATRSPTRVSNGYAAAGASVDARLFPRPDSTTASCFGICRSSRQPKRCATDRYADRASRIGSTGSASATRWRSATSIAVSSYPGRRVTTSRSPVQRSWSARASS